MNLGRHRHSVHKSHRNTTPDYAIINPNPTTAFSISQNVFSPQDKGKPLIQTQSQKTSQYKFIPLSYKIISRLKKQILYINAYELVIANTLFQQHKRRLYTWTSPDGQHRNQIDYVPCSQRWRSSIQSTKTRQGADCGSDHELHIAKFRCKLKKVGKTARPFRYDPNQIPQDYTVEVTNRFKELDHIDRVPEELWTEVRDIIQEAVVNPSPRKRNTKKQNGCLGRPHKQL